MDEKLLYIFINGKRATNFTCTGLPDEVFLVGGLSGNGNSS